jgi:hypothetical protein
MQCRTFTALSVAVSMVLPNLSMASQRWMVFFDSNSTELTAAAQKSIQEFIDFSNGKCPRRVSLVGHLDAAEARTGPITLDIDRARAVAEHFKHLGTPAWTFETIGWGNSQALVVTRIGASEPQNRRVELSSHLVLTSGRLECEAHSGPPVVRILPRCTLVLADGTRCRPW